MNNVSFPYFYIRGILYMRHFKMKQGTFFSGSLGCQKENIIPNKWIYSAACKMRSALELLPQTQGRNYEAHSNSGRKTQGKCFEIQHGWRFTLRLPRTTSTNHVLILDAKSLPIRIVNSEKTVRRNCLTEFISRLFDTGVNFIFLVL